MSFLNKYDILFFLIYGKTFNRVITLLIILLFISICGSSQNKCIYTLIIGLQNINDSIYDAKYKKSYDEEATAGVNWDIYKMEKIAQKNNHEVIKLINQQATSENTVKQIEEIGRKIQKDDIFIFYFSGHGDFIKDNNGDETTGFDQALVLFDDFLIDDDIYNLLKKYFTQTDNLMIIDACHSSTTYKILDLIDFQKSSKNKTSIEKETLAQDQTEFLSECDLNSFPQIEEPFDLIYFGATEDNSTAIGNVNGGLLTYWLDRIITNAISQGLLNNYDYKKLACELNKKMQNYNQYLQYHEIGSKVADYSNKVPFKIY